jgi:hypothetical protein
MDYTDIREILTVSEPKNRQISLKQSKPYSFTSKYIPYDLFLGLVVAAEFGVKFKSDWDITSCHFYTQAAKWDKNNTPVYGLSKQTLSLFDESSIDSRKDLFDNLQELNEPVSYCILLPAKTFPTVGGGFLEVLWIEIIQNNSDSTISISSHVRNGIYERQIESGKRRITSGGVDTDNALWCAATVYPREDDYPTNIGNSNLTNDERGIAKNIRELTLQIVMAIEYLPEAIETTSATVRKQGFGKDTKNTTTWHIRNINIEQKKYTKNENSTPSSETSRQSPRPHWRKYHWRRVATGKGRIEREWRLIQTVYINK